MWRQSHVKEAHEGTSSHKFRTVRWMPAWKQQKEMESMGPAGGGLRDAGCPALSVGTRQKKYLLWLQHQLLFFFSFFNFNVTHCL